MFDEYQLNLKSIKSKWDASDQYSIDIHHASHGYSIKPESN